jgi:hypothetical protein
LCRRRHHGGTVEHEHNKVQDVDINIPKVAQTTEGAMNNVEIKLSANLLQNGITIHNCASFTVAHLALLVN